MFVYRGKHVSCICTGMVRLGRLGRVTRRGSRKYMGQIIIRRAYIPIITRRLLQNAVLELVAVVPQSSVIPRVR